MDCIIPGYPDYSITRLGKIISRRQGKPRLLSTPPMKSGYLQVWLCSDKKKKWYVHRLMWESFKGPVPIGMQINHIDGNKQNNHINNLELVTPKRNMRHAVELGLIGTCERSASAKLSAKDVREIRELCAAGHRQPAIAKAYGIAQTNVSAIKRKITWRG